MNILKFRFYFFSKVFTSMASISLMDSFTGTPTVLFPDSIARFPTHSINYLYGKLLPAHKISQACPGPPESSVR